MLTSIMGALPFEMNHKELNQATHTKQHVTSKAQIYTPLGRHIKLIDQEPQCRSVQFSNKDRPPKVVHGRSGKTVDGDGDEERPQTRLRDGVDGFLQVVIKQPSAPETKDENPAGDDRFLFDFVFLDSSAPPNGISRVHRAEQTKLMASIQNLDQCLKINTGRFDHTRRTIVDDFADNYPHLQKQVTVLIKDQNGTGSRHRRTGMSKKSRIKLELGQGEVVKGVGIGPRAAPTSSQSGKDRDKGLATLQFPQVGKRWHTVSGDQGDFHSSPTVLSPAGQRSAMSMKLRAARKQRDLIWLNGSRPSYINQEGTTFCDFNKGSADQNNQRQFSGIAKSDSAIPTTSLQKQKSTLNDSSAIRPTMPPGQIGYLETDFGFHRERLRGDGGMSMRKYRPDSTQLEKVVGDIAERHIHSCQIPSLHARSSKAYQSVESLRRTIYPFSKKREAAVQNDVGGFHKRGDWVNASEDKRLTTKSMSSPRGKLSRCPGSLHLGKSGNDSLPPIHALNVNVSALSTVPKNEE